MWANPNPWQGGGGWPIQQANYQAMPHDQVDWAALAKQWIAQKESVTPMPDIVSGAPPPPPPPQEHSGDSQSMELCEEGANGGHPNDAGLYGNQSNWNWNGGMPQQQWNTPPQGWAMGGHQNTSDKGPQEFDYNHGSFQQFDYNHGGDNFQPNFPQNHMKPKGDFHGEPPWMRGQPPPPHGGHGPAYPHRPPFMRHPRPMSPVPPEGDLTLLDAAKRKTLPAWIREGLEKMEREKQKKIDREKKEKEMAAAKAAREQAEREAEEELQKEKEGYDQGPRVPRKSRFDSDDEETGKDDGESPEKASSRSVSPTPHKHSPERRTPSPDAFKTEEEKQAELMLKVRRMLTEVLLEVTESEIQQVARDVYKKARAKASKGTTLFCSRHHLVKQLTFAKYPWTDFYVKKCLQC